MITKLNLYKESILVPRNIEGRKDKLKQQNLKLLSQEIINGNLIIDESFIFDESLYKYIKVKQINGHVRIQNLISIIKDKKVIYDTLSDYIPGWLENVVINGDFNCNNNKLKFLKGCPKRINGTFNCGYNELTSLEYGPKIVRGDYFCNNNKTQFTEEYVKSLCDVKSTCII